MNLAFDFPVLVTALTAGLLGSVHCFGMCGGIAGSAGMLTAPGQRSRRDALTGAFLFNLGRISSYALAGAVLATAATGAGTALGVPAWGLWLRLVTGCMILLIGLQYLSGLNLLGLLERPGGWLWNRVRPLVSKTAGLPKPVAAIALGLCWGFLPCGLVYTMLFTAAASGSALRGGLVMAAFGAGTLPSMLGLSLFSGSLALLMRDSWFRRFAGAGLILLAAWSLANLYPGLLHTGH